MTPEDDWGFIGMAIALAHQNVGQGGRPFGALVVKDGAVIAAGVNEILATNDPTAHAEMNAIRAASRKLETPSLTGCAVYASGQPCPMCLAAMRTAGIDAVSYAYSNEDAEPFGLSTANIYSDLARPLPEQSMRIQQLRPSGTPQPEIYANWLIRQNARNSLN